MRPNQQQSILEAEIELTAQELLAPLPTHQVIELDDIVAFETTADAASAANTDEARNTPALDETSEIELTAEQMDAMLEGRWP